MLLAGIEIPDDVISLLLERFSVAELAQVQLVCKELYGLANDQAHWYHRCRIEGYIDPSATTDQSVDWKLVYKNASKGGYLHIVTSEPHSLPNTVNQTRLSKIVSGWNSTFALSHDGLTAYSIGLQSQDWNVQALVPAGAERFKHIAGNTGYFAVSDSAERVFTSDEHSNELQLLFTAPKPIVSLAATEKEVACITAEGHVYGCMRDKKQPQHACVALDIPARLHTQAKPVCIYGGQSYFGVLFDDGTLHTLPSISTGKTSDEGGGKHAYLKLPTGLRAAEFAPGVGWGLIRTTTNEVFVTSSPYRVDEDATCFQHDTGTGIQTAVGVGAGNTRVAFIRSPTQPAEETDFGYSAPIRTGLPILSVPLPPGRRRWVAVSCGYFHTAYLAS